MTSKAFILGALFCAATFSSLHAETKDLQFGIKGGLGLSEISNSGASSKSARVGVQLGGVMTQKLSDSLTMQYEAIYTQKGLTIEGSGTKVEYNLDYLEVPVLAKFKLADKYAVYGGGYGALALSRKAKITFSSITADGAIDSITNSFDYGLLIGVEAQLAERWSVDARYTLGLNNVFTAADSKNSTIAISATYSL